MAFDMGFNFRSTAVTGQSYAVAVLATHAYPTGYTNVDGFSVNAGWTSAPLAVDRASGNDARIAGINYKTHATGGPRTFQVDLSSGSAPGAGNYLVDIAMGDAGAAQLQDFKLLDTSTVLIDGTNGGAGFATLSGHYRDATLTDIAATTTWTGTQVAKTFATTLAKLTINFDDIVNFVDADTVAHFRLTLQVSQSVIPVLMAQYRQRRS